MSKTYAEMPAVEFPESVSMTGEFPSLLAAFAEEHGPAFRVKLESGSDLVFLVGPEANRFVFQTHREYFSHEQGWTPVLGEWFGQGLLNMDPPEHTLHRRMMNPAFTSAYLAAYLPLVHQVIADRTRDWAERDEVDLLAESREIAFDVAAVALAGLTTGPPADRLRELFYGLLHGFDASQGSWEEYEKRQAQMVADLNGLLLPIIAARRAAADGQPRDVLGMIVQARDDDGQPLSDEQILAHVKILLVAGHETTTSLAAWALYLLATRPEDLARVHAEIDATGVAADVPLHVEGLHSLHFLDTFTKETGRLYPPVLQVPRGVLRDVEFAGYVLPAGSRVRLSLSACHRLPAIFADPDRFEPGRFDPPREEDKKTPYALVTFGGGPRVCIGMAFAQQEVKALVAHALRRYHLDPVPDRLPVHVGYWTAFAPDGVHVRARPRDAKGESTFR